MRVLECSYWYVSREPFGAQTQAFSFYSVVGVGRGGLRNPPVGTELTPSLPALDLDVP